MLDSGKQWIVEQFQLDVVEDIFKGLPEVWEVVPEGNGKSTLMGGFGLYHADYMPDAQVMMAASSRDQCEVLFRQAMGFIERTPGLEKRFEVLPGYRRILSKRDGGRIQVYAADERTGDGIIPTLCLIDELHRHKDLRLYRLWRGKLDKRGGQLVTISTAGEPGTEFEETRERIRQSANDIVRNGCHVRAANDQIALHDWAILPGTDVSDIKQVKAANPFSGVTEQILKRRYDSPTMTMAHWRRFVCNLPTRVVEAAVEEAEWNNQGIDDRIPEGEPVALGLDVAWKWDTTAIVPLWMPRRDFRLLGPASVLIPPRDGTSLDPHLVEQAIIDIHQRNPVDTVVMDPERAEQLASWIEEELGATVISHGQSHKPMGLAYDRFMEGLREQILFHSKDPVLTRHVFNAVAVPLPQGGARFDRVSTTRKGGNQELRVIDALIAAAMVHSVISGPPPNDKPGFEVLI